MDMINYYFQLPEGSFWQGKPAPSYLAQYDYHPDSLGRDKSLHVMANLIAVSIWLENANGVLEIKRDGKMLPDHMLRPADQKEFTMVKLCAHIIE